jgi:hypothetical protein
MGRSLEVLRPVVVACALVLAAAIVVGPVSLPLAVLGMALVVAALIGRSAYLASRVGR